jgi:hypothetical protein
MRLPLVSSLHEAKKNRVIAELSFAAAHPN